MVRNLIAPIAFASLAALAGCSAGPQGEVKLGVDVAALDTSALTEQAGGTDSGLALTRVRLLVAHAKIGYTGGGQSDGPTADVGPVVVDLTADEIANGAHREFSLGKLDSGTYGGAEIEIMPLDSDSSDEALADFKSSGASLLVEGTYKGTAFSFAGHFLAEQGTDGEVTVDAAAPLSLALTVDPSAWFLDADGVLLDPTDSKQHDALAVAICETLDTQASTDASAPAAEAANAGGHGDKGHGGGGDQEHCVEAAQ